MSESFKETHGEELFEAKFFLHIYILLEILIIWSFVWHVGDR